MLELDVWLSGLESALTTGDAEVLEEVEHLLQLDPPELLAMFRGERKPPECLAPWLG